MSADGQRQGLGEMPPHPGKVLIELFLTPRKISQTKLAEHLGWSHSKVNKIIAGKRGITVDSALQLADALEAEPEYWLDLQTRHDLYHARLVHRKISKL